MHRQLDLHFVGSDIYCNTVVSKYSEIFNNFIIVARMTVYQQLVAVLCLLRFY